MCRAPRGTTERGIAITSTEEGERYESHRERRGPAAWSHRAARYGGCLELSSGLRPQELQPRVPESQEQWSLLVQLLRRGQGPEHPLLGMQADVLDLLTRTPERHGLAHGVRAGGQADPAGWSRPESENSEPEKEEWLCLS